MATPPPGSRFVSVYLRSNRQSQVPAAPQGRGDQIFAQQNVQTHDGYVGKLESHPWRDQTSRACRTAGISICEMHGQIQLKVVFKEAGTKMSAGEVKITGTLCQADILHVAIAKFTTGDGRYARPNPICGEVVNRSLMQ